MIVRLGLAQIHIIHGNVSANLERATSIIKSAASVGCSFIVFPELFSSGFDLENSASHSLENQDFLYNLKTLQESIPITVGGSLIESDQRGKFYNTFYFIPPGNLIKKYRKTHLFKPMLEHLYFTPGSQLTTADLQGEPVGLSICYDIRFPGLYQKYAQNGCKLIIVSAEFPLSRIEHWKILTRARAVENQVFIAAVNCVGNTNQTKYGGSSVVISPSGQVIVEANSHDEALLFVDINMEVAANLQQRFPVLPDNRPDIYGKPVK